MACEIPWQTVLQRTIGKPQMGRGLHRPLDRRGLALRRRGRGSLLATGCRLVHAWDDDRETGTDALVMVIWRRGKPEAVLHHSDRGSQYTSEPFQRLLADHGVTCSMSRGGNVWDNAAMESFFSSLKTERTASKTYRTRDQAKADVFDYIERFYNPRRRHSTLGYLVRWSSKGRRN